MGQDHFSRDLGNFGVNPWAEPFFQGFGEFWDESMGEDPFCRLGGILGILSLYPKILRDLGSALPERFQAQPRRKLLEFLGIPWNSLEFREPLPWDHQERNPKSFPEAGKNPSVATIPKKSHKGGSRIPGMDGGGAEIPGNSRRSNRDCQIDQHHRNQCQYCRLKKKVRKKILKNPEESRECRVLGEKNPVFPPFLGDFWGIFFGFSEPTWGWVWGCGMGWIPGVHPKKSWVYPQNPVGYMEDQAENPVGFFG
ncbi:hypothetical protein DV515_00018055, partial [Chloebia gouldiae]